jgi:ADP-ribosylglycohydrolase
MPEDLVADRAVGCLLGLAVGDALGTTLEFTRRDAHPPLADMIGGGPSALLILARHAGDPEAAIIRAVNDSRDNDTVAAIVGAAIGALHGESAIPARWRDGLLGRTGANDDGKVEALLASAVERFV